MKIGILCAGDEELEPFLPHIENCVMTEKAMLKIYEGRINGVSIAALFSGVCKVNAAIAAQILIDSYRVDGIINAGTAGGMDESMHIFDTVIATQVAYHDVDDDILTEFHPWMASIYFHANQDLLMLAKKVAKTKKAIYFGGIVTGEKFIKDDMRDEINKRYAPLAVDMESAGVAHTCFVNKIPFISIRTITDTATHAGIANFEQNCKQASILAKNFTVDLLKALKDENIQEFI